MGYRSRAMKQHAARASIKEPDALVIRKILVGIREVVCKRIHSGRLLRVSPLSLDRRVLLRQGRLHGPGVGLGGAQCSGRHAKSGRTQSQKELEDENRNQPSRHDGQII